MTNLLYPLYNGVSVLYGDIPEVHPDLFFHTLATSCGKDWRVASYFAMPGDKGGEMVLLCVLAHKTKGRLGVVKTEVKDGRFPSVAAACPQVQVFEREIAEQFGIVPEGHPWFKPVRFHETMNGAANPWGKTSRKDIRVGVTDYYRVEGESVHEVAVGPVHAGIIEPGHFRFQCHGEEVFHLEISLGYQHRGIEKMLAGGPYPRTLRQMEAVAGDTTIGHGTAYCMIVEALGRANVPAQAEVTRGVALELERLANHTGDLGAIAGDVGYLPTASFCGRIRGGFLNMSAVLCGSRFGRGLLVPGGTVFPLTKNHMADLSIRLEKAREELDIAVNLLWERQSVMARLEGTGAVSLKTAEELGLVGPAARASGIKRDVREDFPFGIFRMASLPMVTGYHGDVCARAMIRWHEAHKSVDFILDQLRHMPDGPHFSEIRKLEPGRMVVAMTEGWRGEICHTVVTDGDGWFRRYKITDPSFHNWQGLAMALRGQQISDFPLCNKSFNLSYCGYDL
jgi:Ni,Fe-hydrogenase III large subunit